MSVTNVQYNAIMRNYEETQNKNRHLLAKRQEEVYTKVPAYQEIERSISSLCVSQCKKMLAGDDAALEEMKQELHDLSTKKELLLLENGFAADYLEPIYDCPDCKDTGYLSNGQKCHCLRQTIITLLYEQSNLKEVLEQENFAHLSTSYYEGEDLKNYEQILAQCQNFVSDFKTTYQNLFFYGTVGTGKSFLTNCIAKELIEQGQSVLYFSSNQLFNTLAQYTFDYQKKDLAESFYDDLYNCDLLIIDDLGTECTNRLINTELFNCVNERAMRKKSIIISSNLQLGDLTDRYSERIFSRITSNFQLLKLTGPDIRITKKLAHRK